MACATLMVNSTMATLTCTCRQSTSAREYTAMVPRPSSLHALITLTAISPLLAIRTLVKFAAWTPRRWHRECLVDRRAVKDSACPRDPLKPRTVELPLLLRQSAGKADCWTGVLRRPVVRSFDTTQACSRETLVTPRGSHVAEVAAVVYGPFSACRRSASAVVARTHLSGRVQTLRKRLHHSTH